MNWFFKELTLRWVNLRATRDVEDRTGHKQILSLKHVKLQTSDITMKYTMSYQQIISIYSSLSCMKMEGDLIESMIIGILYSIQYVLQYDISI